MLGDFGHWCCGFITEKQELPLFEMESTLQDKYDNLKQLLSEEHAKLFQVSTALTNMSAIINQNFEHLQEASTDLELQFHAKVLTMFQVKLYYDYYQDIFYHCNNHKIPPTLLNSGTLKTDLETLQNQLVKQNLGLAMLQKPWHITPCIQIHVS